MNNVISMVIAIIALVVAIISFTQGHIERYQISSTGENLVFRVDVVSGHLTAHRVHSKEEPSRQLFIQEIATMAK